MASAGVITEFLASVGFKADEKSLKASLAKVAAFGVAVQAVAVGIYAGITRVASGEAAMARQAEKLGTTSDKLQELGYVAEQSGSSLDAVTRSMEAMVSKNPRIKDAAKALEVAGERMKAMNEAQRKAYAARMGIDPSLIPALISDASALKDEFRAMYAVAGIDAKEAAKASKEFMGEIGKLATMVNLLAKSVALAFISKIRHDVERLRRVIMENFDAIKQFLEILISVVLRVASVISAFAYRVIKWVASIVQWFGKLDDGQKKLVVGAGLLLAAWKLLNAGFLTTPLGMIITGLLGILALVDDYLTYMEGGESYFDWGPWAGTIETARAAIAKVVNAVVAFISSNQDLVKTLAKGMALFMGLKKAAGMVGLVSGAFKGLNMVIKANPIGLLLGLFCMGAMWVIDNWEMVRDSFLDIWRKIEDAFPNFAAWIQAGIAAITAFGKWFLSFFTGNFDQAGQQALQLFASLGDMIIAALSMLGIDIVGIFSAVWEAVEKAFPDFRACWDAIKAKAAAVADFFVSLWRKIEDAFPNFAAWIQAGIAAITAFGKWFLSFFTGNFDQAGQHALQLFASLGDMAIAALSMLGSAIAGIFSAAWEAVEKAFPDFGVWAAGAVQSITETFAVVADFFVTLWQGIVDWLVGLWSGVTDAFPDFGAWASGAVESMMEIFGAGIQWIRDKIKSLVSFLPDWLKEKMGITVDGDSGEPGKPGKPAPPGGDPGDPSGTPAPSGNGSGTPDADRALNNALAASEATSRPALTPSPAQAAAMDNSVKQDVKLDAKTEINVYSSDPVAAGNQAADRQSQVNADLVRHTKGAMK